MTCFFRRGSIFHGRGVVWNIWSVTHVIMRFWKNRDQACRILDKNPNFRQKYFFCRVLTRNCAIIFFHGRKNFLKNIWSVNHVMIRFWKIMIKHAERFERWTMVTHPDIIVFTNMFFHADFVFRNITFYKQLLNFLQKKLIFWKSNILLEIISF